MDEEKTMTSMARRYMSLTGDYSIIIRLYQIEKRTDVFISYLIIVEIYVGIYLMVFLI